METGIKKAGAPPADDPWMTIPQAAREIGIHKQTVLTYALDGKLDTQVVAGQRFVSRESVDRVKAERDAAGET